MKILESEGLVKVYQIGGERKTVVDGVSLSIGEGEILAFLGRNGAGKTTTIKMLAGLVRPTAGRVSILGEDPNETSSALRNLGAVLEGSRNVYWRFTALENLEYFAALRGLSRKQARRRGTELLERFGLADVRHQTLKSFSRGMQQKVALIVALLHRPKLLLLDEPTIALDIEAAEQVKELVREIASEGHAVLLTTHHLDVAEEVADRIAIIDRGKLLVEEPTDQLLRRFSGRAYRIEFEGRLQNEQRHRLEALGVENGDGRLVYRGEPSGLYEVLDVLRPLPIKRAAEDRDTLTKIFLDLVNETRA